MPFNDYENSMDIGRAQKESEKIINDFGLIFEKHSAINVLSAQFNRYKLPIPPGAVLKNARTFVFLTKPDLNMDVFTNASSGGFIKNGGNTETLNDSYVNFLKNIKIYDIIAENLTLGNYNYVKSNFIPIVTNCCHGVDVPDVSLKTITSAETFKGWKVPMARNSVDSRNNPTFSLQLTENKKLLCYHLFRMWIHYIELLDSGLVHRKNSNIRDNILDYASSLFHIVVGPDGKEILYICKYVGVFPTKDNSSIFGGSDGTLETPLKFSVDMQAFKFVPITSASDLIHEFNLVSGVNGKGAPTASLYNNTMTEENMWVGNPFITMNDGKYELHFAQRR